MNWTNYAVLIIGIAIGVFGHIVYAKYFSVVYKLGESLLNRAKGDAEKAWVHVSKL